ncbi:hypothetical protein [Yinghuangia soli]|uniref:Uncharacterized protein n=1 Tax=Yinghuangia soli TaxID=2908204 RepID=A0AA41U1X4_9ACTN|nr:hypothetical protein [Yinghuangia soli]MCF2526529.1 hypothetical protein [Yinghuangia soli]
MHNDQHPHPFLREEHRRQFEQVVDEALHLDDTANALTASSGMNAEQLRTATLAQADGIAAKASDEYRRLVDSEDHAAAGRSEQSASPFAETAEGVGVFALTTSITIIVAAISAAVFLAAYYVIKAATDHDKSVAPMRMAGFASLAIALGAAMLAGLAMLFHAGRNQRDPAPDTDVRQAREEWREALLTQGVLPFMSTQLAAAAAGGDPRVVPLQPPRNGNGRRSRDRRAPERDHEPEGDQPTGAAR